MFADLQTKVIVFLSGLLLLLASNLGSYFYGHYKGVQDQIGEQAKAEVKKAEKVITSVVKNSEQIVAGVKNDQVIGAKVNEKFIQSSNQVKQTSDADRSAIRASGGLRITAGVCAGSDKPSVETISSSTGFVDGTSPGTVALPQLITEDLLNLTDEADQVSERLRGLQEWIRENGFYSTE